MAITQLSVFLMNQPGALIEAVQAISEAGINIRAMSISEANDFGILRIIVSDTDAVCKLLICMPSPVPVRRKPMWSSGSMM